jgi:hypothetical protein
MMQLVTAVAAAAALVGSPLPSDSVRPASAMPLSIEVQDTTRRRRPHAIEVSDWYGRRLTIHRTLSYVTLPVFGAQYIAGQRLFSEGAAAPEWAKITHRSGATALAGIFTVNTVTGLWNLWDSRGVENHRALRTTHALMMLTADAAFTYAGAKLSNEAETSLEKRKLHRTIALSATGLTVASGLIMKLFNK